MPIIIYLLIGLYVYLFIEKDVSGNSRGLAFILYCVLAWPFPLALAILIKLGLW